MYITALQKLVQHDNSAVRIEGRLLPSSTFCIQVMQYAVDLILCLYGHTYRQGAR